MDSICAIQLPVFANKKQFSEAISAPRTWLERSIHRGFIAPDAVDPNGQPLFHVERIAQAKLAINLSRSMQ